ncbi:MAG: GntR family transcriptional regulator [Anaerolineae bacterium]|jgi:DNA-binding GntR family transcriptional regulator
MEQVDLMYEAIKQKILDLEIDPVQPIEDRALVRDTGGSLTQVRQALDRLSEDGIVERRRRRWYVTRAATASTMHEIFEVRTTLEGMCARLAAERITPQEVEEMEQLLRDFDRTLRGGDNQALLAVDRKFHQKIYQASGNRFLARALDDMYDLIYRLFFFALDRMGSVRANVEDHRDILAALRAGDGRAAERLIQAHIIHFQAMVEALL